MRINRFSAGLAAFAAVVVGAACSVTNALEPDGHQGVSHFCDCQETSFIELQFALNARIDLTAVETSGPGCDAPASDQCAQADGSIARVSDHVCATYRIPGTNDGACHIVVRFGHRESFVADETFSTPADAPCGPHCSRRPLGLDGGALRVQ